MSEPGEVGPKGGPVSLYFSVLMARKGHQMRRNAFVGLIRVFAVLIPTLCAYSALPPGWMTGTVPGFFCVPR